MDYFIGLGSNLGDRLALLSSGLDGLGRSGLLPAARSSVWETEPVGIADPGWFLNMVALVRSELAPAEVLKLLQRIERDHGRDRSSAGGSRTLDLDLLLAGETILRDATLALPHPRMWDRSFVLEPLAELAPEFRAPGRRGTVGERARRLRGRGPAVRRLGPLQMLAPRQAIPI